MDYTDSKTIDFIEYREMKKGIDLNLYLEMDDFYFLNIYHKTAMELDEKFNELVQLDKKITFLKRKGSLNKQEEILYNEYVDLGQFHYERYSFLEDKMTILDKVFKERKNILSNNKDLNSKTIPSTISIEDELLIYLNQHNENDDDK